MSEIIDITGEQFERLTVLKIAGRIRGQAAWLCKCACGKKKIVSSSNLRKGISRSCGCLARDVTRARSITHGRTLTPEYHTWRSIVQRCCNSNSKDFKYWGGRGIKMCARWRNSFENFLADMGERPSAKHRIDRIDNNGNYTPSNCRWATPREQASNTRTNRLLTFRGETKTVAQWAREMGVSRQTLRHRLEAGWTIRQAITVLRHQGYYIVRDSK